jgi:hypothetical protein
MKARVGMEASGPLLHTEEFELGIGSPPMRCPVCCLLSLLPEITTTGWLACGEPLWNELDGRP